MNIKTILIFVPSCKGTWKTKKKKRKYEFVNHLNGEVDISSNNTFNFFTVSKCISWKNFPQTEK